MSAYVDFWFQLAQGRQAVANTVTNLVIFEFFTLFLINFRNETYNAIKFRECPLCLRKCRVSYTLVGFIVLKKV
jgi:hypothetical protein